MTKVAQEVASQEVASEDYGFLPPAHLCLRLFGQSNAEHAFLRAWRGGFASQSWLLCGSRGVGKASFAYAAARFLLDNERSYEQKKQLRALSSCSSSIIFQQVAAGTHPDLVSLSAVGEGEITVDQARSLVSFLHKTPMFSSYRVGIVDSADRLNREAANALLKVVEEPSRRVVLLLVCHSSAALIATLRSRCRPLSFSSVALEPIVEFLCEHGAERSVGELIARLSGGSFYYAGLLCEAGGESFIRAFGEAISASLISASLISASLANSQKDGLQKDGLQKDGLLESEKMEHLLGLLGNDKPTAEAFRFLWQRFLSCAVRAGLDDASSSFAASEQSHSSSLAMLELLSVSARKALSQTRVTFWQELWQSTVANLLASRSARGGDFTLSASFALASLSKIR